MFTMEPSKSITTFIESSFSILHRSCFQANVAFTAYLLQNGLSTIINSSLSDYQCKLCFQIIIKGGISTLVSNNYYKLSTLIYFNQVELQISKNKLDTSTECPSFIQWTPLHYYINNVTGTLSMDYIKMLIYYKANPTILDVYELSPFHYLLLSIPLNGASKVNYTKYFECIKMFIIEIKTNYFDCIDINYITSLIYLSMGVNAYTKEVHLKFASIMCPLKEVLVLLLQLLQTYYHWINAKYSNKLIPKETIHHIISILRFIIEDKINICNKTMDINTRQTDSDTIALNSSLPQNNFTYNEFLCMKEYLVLLDIEKL